jgi:hypothetical protein
MEVQFCPYCHRQMEALLSMTCAVPGEYADSYDFVCPDCD